MCCSKAAKLKFTGKANKGNVGVFDFLVYCLPVRPPGSCIGDRIFRKALFFVFYFTLTAVDSVTYCFRFILDAISSVGSLFGKLLKNQIQKCLLYRRGATT